MGLIPASVGAPAAPARKALLPRMTAPQPRSPARPAQAHPAKSHPARTALPGNDNWATRHPERAAQEQALRRQARAIRKGFGHKRNGTPETHFHASRTRQGTIARLYQAGHITIDDLARAAEIAGVAEQLGRDCHVSTASLETRVDNARQHGGAFFEALGAVRRELAYTAWRASLDALGPGAKSAVLGLVIDDCGLEAAARRGRMRRSAAKAALLRALDLWADLIGETAKRIGREELDRAHARLG